MNQKGFISLYKQSNTYYIEIPDSILGKDILLFSRTIKPTLHPANSDLEGGGYPGSKTVEEVIRFYKQADRITVRIAPYQRNSTAALRTDKDLENIQLYDTFSLAIKSTLHGGKSNLVDIESFLFSGNDLFFFNDYSKRGLAINKLVPDSSSIIFLNFNPSSADLITQRSYEGQKEIMLNTSMVLLPSDPMKPRPTTPSIGYYQQSIPIPSSPTSNAIITRWKLEPKAEDLLNYQRGKLVEPKQPIVFYIDSTTPSKWIPYFIKGVEMWQGSFEKIGFKNAIQARLLKEASPFAAYGSAYSTIHYLASTVKDATYSSIVDPRSGEIIQSHILFSSGVIEKLQDEYFISASPSDRRIQQPYINDSITGTLIVGLVAHEIGHALGFAHNMAASACTPVKKLKDPRWLQLHGGHTASMMDYAWYNYVAEPQDSIKEQWLLPHVGLYDHIAVKYGYQYFPHANDLTEEKHKKKIISELRKNNLIYIDEHNEDPLFVGFVLGDDLIASGMAGINNLKYILSHLLEWNGGTKADTIEVKKKYNLLIRQFTLYLGYVFNNIGGKHELLTKDGSKTVKPVSFNVQEKSFTFIDDQLFNDPQWLLDKKIIAFTGLKEIDIITRLNRSMLAKFMSGRFLSYLTTDSLSSTEYKNTLLLFKQLHTAIWHELNSGAVISDYRKNLQQNYVTNLVEFIKPRIIIRIPGDSSNPSKRLSFAKNELNIINANIIKTLSSFSDPETIMHLQLLKSKIEAVLLN
jgi:hypothetical protein